MHASDSARPAALAPIENPSDRHRQQDLQSKAGAGERESTKPQVREFTLQEVRDTCGDTQALEKKDILLAINEIVYDVTSFLGEHPGGEDIVLDVAGQDATTAFEDIGHSDEAREILEGLKIGILKRMPGDPVPKRAEAAASQSSGSADGSFGFGIYAILLIGAALAYFFFTNTQAPAPIADSV